LTRIAFLLVLAACADYAIFDPRQPIDVTPINAWTDGELQELAAATQCWNLAVGIDFRFTTSPSDAQRVVASFNDLECLGTDLGQYTAGFDGNISLCPDFTFEEERFLVMTHELGHASGIRVEGTRSDSIMGQKPSHGALFGEPLFSSEDLALFAAAQPSFTPMPACKPDFFRSDTGSYECRCD
jgi:hypothetical protein